MAHQQSEPVMTAEEFEGHLHDNVHEYGWAYISQIISNRDFAIRAQCAEEVRELVDVLIKCRNDYFNAYNACYISQAGIGIEDGKIMELRAKLPQIKIMIEQIDYVLAKFDKPTEGA